MSTSTAERVEGFYYDTIYNREGRMHAFVLEKNQVGSGMSTSITIKRDTEVFLGTKKIANGNIGKFLERGVVLSAELLDGVTQRIVIRK